MRVTPQIKALFLLGIFMLMSFHQVIPHAHHEHQEEKKEIAHRHSGEDHHHEKERKNKQDGFLSYLLAIHSHSGTPNEIPVFKEYSENFRVQKTETKKNTSNKYYSENWVLADQDLKTFEIYQPPNEYFNPYLSLLSLRGPPELV
ncbi:MAG: hypothetical protein CMP12_11480 [Zunongwangia sp.]|uniref:hypothetical protein n=1 Tax=Zunongwangia profunda TaxID=398743 RepID=UPI000C8F7012|nr:hypothetical protein [Zunongwangia profunda]MAG86168.1 hypothetical protein [Flavobacteriaceae bacterium]MAO36504.1 hypothetical protein [Zunongwangia sp.]|tara:strand:+ start:4454 stop:4888 length:435 start_codon:yes stop_codon:yes gene_type:complete